MTDELAWHDFRNRAVLVTGGTKGIGLAIGLAFGQRGASVTLTHKWNSADLQALRAQFVELGAPEPTMVDADVAQAEDLSAVLMGIRAKHQRLHAFISNVAFAPLVRSFTDYNRRDLAAAIDYTAWPLVSYTRAAKEIFGSYIDSYGVNYDIVAASKAVLETLCRYMNQRLRRERPAASNL